MAGRTKRAFSFGMKLAKIGASKLEKEIMRVYKIKKIDKRKAKQIFSAVLKEAKVSGRHFEAFAQQEAERISKKVKPMMKEVARKAYKKARTRVSKRRKR
jgi:DNA-directed RNA polymerase subunit F